jgi:hypothetical protein
LISVARRGANLHLSIMFAVSEADAAVIRAAYERDGELSAAIELRRLFPGIADNENARICAPGDRGLDTVAGSDAFGDAVAFRQATLSRTADRFGVRRPWAG